MLEPPTQLTNQGHEPTASTPSPRERERFLLWIDGVGGFLICLAPRVLLGHGSADSNVDVPILADVARQHAWIERDGQNYFVEAARAVQVHRPTILSSQPEHRTALSTAGRALIRHGDLITLGKSCQFTFAQAVPVSASARLDLVSGHRLWRALRGVLLMAETLVLGPGSLVHVQIADLAANLVLFRQKPGLAVNYAGKVWLNGEPAKNRTNFGPGDRITVEDITMSLERIDGT